MEDYIIAVIILASGLLIGTIIFIALRRKYGMNVLKQKQVNATVEFSLKLHKPFMSGEEMKFLEVLHRALPNEVIAFPHVPVKQIVEPKDNKVAYNQIDGNLDICVFLIKTMEPILVIDLYENDPIKQGLKIIEPVIVKALNAAKLPSLKVVMQETYDEDELRAKVISSLKPEMLLQLKDFFASKKNETK